MRRVLCYACGMKYPPVGTRQIYEASNGEPAEFQRLIAGLAKQPQKAQRTIHINGIPEELSPEFYECDNCSAHIKRGDRCFAWSVWNEFMEEIPKWEHEYLTDS